MSAASRDDERRLWITRRQREIARRRNESAGGSALPAAHLRFTITALAAALPPDGKRRLLELVRDYSAGRTGPVEMAAALQALVDEHGVSVALCHGAEAGTRIEPSPRMFGRCGSVAVAAAAGRPAVRAIAAAAAVTAAAVAAALSAAPCGEARLGADLLRALRS
jgi:hypothetical protein